MPFGCVLQTHLYAPSACIRPLATARGLFCFAKNLIRASLEFGFAAPHVLMYATACKTQIDSRAVPRLAPSGSFGLRRNLKSASLVFCLEPRNFFHPLGGFRFCGTAMRIAQIAALSVNTSSFNPNVLFCVNCFVREYHNIFKSAPNTSEQID